MPPVLVVNPMLVAGDFKAFLEQVRKNPGRMNYGSAGSPRAVVLTGLFNVAFLGLVTVAFLVLAPSLVGIFTRDPEVVAMLHEEGRRLNIPQRKPERQEIRERCLYAMINEGARLLDEGIALRASDIDVVYTAGYGFPRYRGGPMFYADVSGDRDE